MPTSTDTAALAPRHEIAFFNADLPDLNHLLADVRPGIEVILLDPAADGIAQVAQALAGRGDVAAIHLFGHGAQGLLQLGASTLDADGLQEHCGDLAAIGAVLAEDGDILVYGCDTGAGSVGADFVATLASLTGADVAASDDPTGGTARGGDWALEVTQGEVGTAGAVGASGAEYAAALAIQSGPVYTYGSNTWSFSSIAQDAQGNIYLAQKLDYTTVSLKKWDGSGWTELTKLTASMTGDTTLSDDLSLQVNPNGKLDLLFRHAKNVTSGVDSLRGVKFGEYDIASNTWTTKLIQQSSHPNGWLNYDDPALKVGPGNILHAAYLFDDASAHDYYLRYASSADNGATWNVSTVVSTTIDGIDELHDPRIEVDPAGNVYVFYVREDGQNDYYGNLYVQVKAAGGNTWSAAQKLADRVSGPPQVTNDGAGHFYVGYGMEVLAQNGTVTGTALAVSSNAGGSWVRDAGMVSDDRTNNVAQLQYADGKLYMLAASTAADWSDVDAFFLRKVDGVWQQGYRHAPELGVMDTGDFGELGFVIDAAGELLVVTERYDLQHVEWMSGTAADFGLVSNAAPVITGLDGDNSTFTAGAADAVADFGYLDNQENGNASVDVLDGDSPDFVGGNLTVVQTDGSTDGYFELDTSSDEVAIGADAGHLGGTFSAGAKVFARVSVNWVEVGVVDAAMDGRDGHGLKIAFTTAAADAGVAALLVRYLAYGAPSAGPRSFSVTVDDGDGGVSTPAVIAMNGIDVEPPTVALGASRTTFKAGETATVTFTFSEAPVGFSLDNVSVGGGRLDGLAATANPLVYTATFTPAQNAQHLAGTVSVGAGTFTDASGNPNPASTVNLAFDGDTRAPVVSEGNLTISGASGTGGAFRIGDTVTLTWNDGASGDHNGDTASASVDFGQFGGGIVAAVKSGDTWSASHTIAPGAIDAAGRVPTITVADGIGNVTAHVVANGATVDNAAPTVTDAALAISGGSGLNGAYIAGDTVTATWNGAFDNNADVAAVSFDFSQFGGPAGVAATRVGAVWSATYTLAPGALESVGRNVVATVTDDAGNARTVADGSNARVDTLAPHATAMTLSGTPGAGATAVDFVLTFSEAVDGVDVSDLSLALTGAAGGNIASVTGSGSSYTVHVDGIAGNGTLQVVLANTGTGIADLAGNAMQGGYAQGAVYSTAFNAMPVIGSNGGGSTATIGVAEKQRAVTTVAAVDADGDSVSYGIGGGADAALFEIDAATGQLRFKAVPAVGAPLDADHDNRYEVQVTAADDKGGSSLQALTVTVLADLDGDGTPDVDDNDIDNDGRPNSIEDAVPGANGGHGDGNGDGVADSAQVNVASLPTTVAGNPYATLAVADGYTLTGVSAGAAPGSLPRGVKLPLGQLDFTIGHVAPGGTVEMSIYVDASLNVNGYYKQDNNGVWKNIAKPVTTAGNKTVITFELTDGGLYDSDRTVNGSISDPGGVALIVPQITSNGGATSATVQVMEHTAAVTTVTASAVGPVSYAIAGGADAALFQIDAQTGVLAFRSAPDHGHPLDQGDTVGNNTYVVQVKASDASGSELQTLTVNVASAATPPQSTPSPAPVESTVDGVKLSTATRPNSDGSTSQVIAIPVVVAGREESVGQNTVADIPLASSGGKAILAAQLPTGYGLQVVGQEAPGTAGTSLADLIREIKAHTSTGSADQNNLVGGGSGFLAGLDASMPLLVQSIVPTVASGAQLPGEALTISGQPSAPGGVLTALVIDTSALAGMPHLQLQNVEFAAIVGAAHVTGGDGAQKVWGDSASQYIVLGADDDVLHGGDGDDTVGSGAGNDKVYGDGGNDIVFGGTGDDYVDGGSGIDTVQLAGKGRADYTVRMNADGNLVFTHRDGGIDGTDTIANVEVLRFMNGHADTTPQGSVARVAEALLGHAPDAASLQAWNVALAGGAGAAQVARQILDASGQPASDADFLHGLYAHALNREPDAPGLAFWTDALAHGASRADVALAFADSPERLALPQGYDVTVGATDIGTLARMYDTLFGRAPDADGMNNWLAHSEAGMATASIADAFIASSEAIDRYGRMSDAAFVAALYQGALHRTGSQAEVAGWTSLLANGKLDRGDVLLGFADSVEKIGLVGMIDTTLAADGQS
ncbi:DUF4347 domain-containing protein [Massilia sp. YIM B02763]|uniref:DUF4347 domain-containing protein n=1 Tax=Massilia sp. YIM B02763 TaxID=3050130 RepID=UPI0025B6C707|nr:DUF4347 domain-containing protein [Massilia sp. YIM B02763]MDN4056203.1 DUF4347 domain-containing protein [Massilia sp. YIM B02763]